MFKKKTVSTIALGTALLLLGGCASSKPAQAPAGKYKDGIYFAQGEFDEKGWKYVVTLEVKDGKIVSADWNGANKAGGPDKDTLSKAGKYGLKAKGGAKAEWHEEAEKVEAYLIQTQDPTKITYKDNEGHTDAISGATISVKEFFELADKALANGPVGKGPYKDGAYYAEEPAYSKDWKYTASLTVINGNIVAADWNGVNINGGKDKDTLSKDGGYGMKAKGGAKAEWHEEAEKAEAYLVANQDPSKVTYKDDAGHSDTISGATIAVKPFFELVKKALDNGPIAQGSFKDGFYYAQAKEFKNGFKSMAHIAVKNGKIVGVDFNAINEKQGQPDKDNYSKSGQYGLVAKGGAKAEWHEQVAKAEAYLLQTQDPTKITYKDDAGHTDAISGATISLKEFFDLSQEALQKAK